MDKFKDVTRLVAIVGVKTTRFCIRRESRPLGFKTDTRQDV
jgi:hypothetical protein